MYVHYLNRLEKELKVCHLLRTKGLKFYSLLGNRCLVLPALIRGGAELGGVRYEREPRQSQSNDFENVICYGLLRSTSVEDNVGILVDISYEI